MKILKAAAVIIGIIAFIGIYVFVIGFLPHQKATEQRRENEQKTTALCEHFGGEMYKGECVKQSPEVIDLSEFR